MVKPPYMILFRMADGTSFFGGELQSFLITSHHDLIGNEATYGRPWGNLQDRYGQWVSRAWLHKKVQREKERARET